MKDLDFDELDRAVKAVMNESVDTTPKPVTKAAPVPRSASAPSAAPTATPTPDPAVQKAAPTTPISTPTTAAMPRSTTVSRPLVGGSKDSFKPQPRTRLFMDVKPSTPKSSSDTSPDPLMDISSPIKAPTRRSASVQKAAPSTAVAKADAGVESTGSIKPKGIAPAPRESQADTGVSTTESGSPAISSTPKEPFEDVFASLKGEIDSFKLEDDPEITVKSGGSSESSNIDSLKSSSATTLTDLGDKSADVVDESNSFSPFLSSVAIDKRPLGGYFQVPESGAESAVGVSQAESAARVSGAEVGDTPKSVSEAGSLYGVDPLEGVEFQDVDGALVNSGDVDGDMVGSPVALSGSISEVDVEDKASSVVDDLGSRIARELSGEDTSDESGDRVVVEGRSNSEPRVELEVESNARIDEEFHKETPIHQDNEVVPDFDVEFKEVEIRDPNDEIVSQSLAKINKMNKERAEAGAEPKVDASVVEAPVETTAPVSESIEVEPEEETAPAPKEIKLAGVTVGPDDTHISVEDVAAMEESIAGRTEEPEKVKKRPPRKPRVISEFKQRKESLSKEAPAILKEGGPTAINQQYKQPAVVASGDVEHKTFNTDSFAMPVGTKSKKKMGVSIKGIALVAIAAILVGIVSAFGLFYSGLI